MSATDWLSIDLTDPDRKTMLAGGHEMPRTLFLSIDSGGTWKNIGGPLPDMTNCTMPLLLTPTSFLVGCGGFGGGVTGIWGSTDSGATWTQVSRLGGGSPPLVASDGTIYWVGVDGSLAASTDQGQSFTLVTPPATLAPWSGSVSGVTPVELPAASGAASDGSTANRIAAMGNNAVIVSADRGKHWVEVSPPFTKVANESARGVAYSPFRHEFYVWHSSCVVLTNNNPIGQDDVMSFPYK